MNRFVFALRRPLTTFMLLVALSSGGVVGVSRMRGDAFPPLNAAKIYGYLEYIGTTAKKTGGAIFGKLKAYFHKDATEHEEEPRKVVVTSPKVMDVTISQQFVCQIKAQRHIEICALEGGYLDEIKVREGQAVKKDDVMFKIRPVLYKTKRDAEAAEARLADLEFKFTEQLSKNKVGGQSVVSPNEVALFAAKKARAQAKADQAQAELDFTEIKAQFDGIVDRLLEREGSLIKEGDVLTTLSDNSVMWVYFNVPEGQYFEYMRRSDEDKRNDRIELELANHDKFEEAGTIGAIEAKFNNETGNILFRADFPNPKRLLRHGQTGTIWIRRTEKDSLVIPQRAIFERLDKRYVWVVGEDHVAHQSLITIKHELDDIFVVKDGVKPGDKIVFEGVRQIEEDAKVEYEFEEPEVALKNQKFRAE